jgi:phosphoglycerate dehydrogenase-like enzyme
VFALLLELAHAVGLHEAAVKAEEWAASLDYSFWKTQLELAGTTMAIVGYGRIGSAVGELAHAFGMSVLGVSDTFQGGCGQLELLPQRKEPRHDKLTDALPS